MSKDRNKKREDVPDLTIFEERKLHRVSAQQVLAEAKKQEAKKLKQGYRYVTSADKKTSILTKKKK